jgi:hypothetical protein
MHQEPKNAKAAKHQAAIDSESFASEPSVPRIDVFLAQGTVASLGPVAGAEMNRLTPDAHSTVSRQFVSLQIDHASLGFLRDHHFVWNLAWE